jgi:hypothetical protein
VRQLQDGLRHGQLVAPQHRGRPSHHMPVESVLDDHRALPLHQRTGRRVGVTLTGYENHGSPHHHPLLKTIFI